MQKKKERKKQKNNIFIKKSKNTVFDLKCTILDRYEFESTKVETINSEVTKTKVKPNSK